MKIGILSDTHNHLAEARHALDLLLHHDVNHLVHCGDAGEDVIDLVSATCQSRGIRAHVALGNCDRFQNDTLRFAPHPAGVDIGERLAFELEGLPCTVLHGHREAELDLLAASGQFAYIFTGHTHRRLDEQIGRTRILNPGSCARPRGGPATVLLLDPASGKTDWLVL